MKFAVIRSGGKQYIVNEGDVVVVDNINADADSKIELETLAQGDDEKNTIELGTPLLDTKVKGTVLETLKGDKIRVARYKSKTRQRRVMGFRPLLTRIKIETI